MQMCNVLCNDTDLTSPHTHTRTHSLNQNTGLLTSLKGLSLTIYGHSIGSLSLRLYDLSGLEVLHLDNVRTPGTEVHLIDALPDDFGRRFPCLRRLLLSSDSNRLVRLPDSICEIGPLEFLSVRASLSELPPNIDNLSRLSHLEIHTDALSMVLPAAIGNLRQLQLLIITKVSDGAPLVILHPDLTLGPKFHHVWPDALFSGAVRQLTSLTRLELLLTSEYRSIPVAKLDMVDMNLHSLRHLRLTCTMRWFDVFKVIPTMEGRDWEVTWNPVQSEVAGYIPWI